MPNWCANYTTISGKTEQVHALLNKFKEKNGILTVLNPEPENLENVREWRVAYWGTKWDVPMAELSSDIIDNEKEGTSVIYLDYLTAWGPAVEAFQHFTDENPEFDITVWYYESGMAFGGMWDSDGSHVDWDTSDEIPPELDEIFNITEMLEEFDDY